MDSEGVSLPLIHEHLMMPWNDLISRRGDCCGRFIKDISDGYYCKERGESSKYIEHSSHSNHTLQLRRIETYRSCDLCGWKIKDLGYHCEICVFDVDCVWDPLSEVIHPSEVNHCYHSLHSLKLLTYGLPDYSDGKCSLCGTKVDDRLFYHCSSCNVTLDLRCFKDPPQQSLFDSNTHDHQLTLLPKLISFACNVCGLKGDRSPYLCVQCEFMIHQDCLGLPRLININRHDHCVSRTSLLGVVNSVCGVCRQKLDWTYGGYVVHSKCATRNDVWNGKGVPEETEDIEPYVVIDTNTIQHFSHKEHYLRLHDNGVLCEENKWCSACTHPISLQFFYGCIGCDFFLHKYCTEFPRKKRHVLHNEWLTLVTTDSAIFQCTACLRYSNGFRYDHGNKKIDL